MINITKRKPETIIMKLKERITFLFNRYGYISFSQEGEDILLRDLFQNKKSGFYIDVGAYHPKRFSNTCYFYNLGWKGINIDANKKSIELFNSQRSKDINIHSAVSNKEKMTAYYEFYEGAINTIEKEFVNLVVKRGNKIKSVSKIKSLRLETILNKYDIPNIIDFLSIDVEGHCLEVLQSNNWNKYSPKVLLVEDDDFSFFKKSKIHLFVSKKKYLLIARTIRTSIYKKID